MVTRATVDFETHPIEEGSAKSPVPVGVAIRHPGGRQQYLSWGHPCANNCDRADAELALWLLCRYHRLVMHNAQFDLRVLWEHFELWPEHGFDDTKLAMYLFDPNHATLSLKPLASELLGMPPDEQDEMHDWLHANYLPARRTKNKTKYTAYAPGDIAGKYAIGDVARTWGLWAWCRPRMDTRTKEAYRRELDIIPITIDMMAEGVRVNVRKLARDTGRVKKLRAETHGEITQRLGDINLNSRQQLACVLTNEGLVTNWAYTPTGEKAVGIPALRETCEDQELVDKLELYSKIGKLVGTYMEPWVRTGGRFYPYFNPIRVDGESGGTRTGRFSSNFQQIPKRRFGDLPYMREYVLPDEGHTLVWRDYSQQEVRILAHFEQGRLLEAFNADPHLDMHDHVSAMMGGRYSREVVKTVNFLVLYGGGGPRLAAQLGIELTDAQAILRAHREAMPGIQLLKRELNKAISEVGYIRTWGGRKYVAEPGFEYKLINLLIQGSAADQTKEAMVRYDGPGRIVMQVHDELVVSAPTAEIDEASEALRWAMEDMDGWDVAMLTDERRGRRWG